MKFFLSVLIIGILILPSSQVFAQQLSMGNAVQEKIAITIDETGTAHVTHIVNGSSLGPVQVEMVRGNITKFSVTDVNGSLVEYGSMQKSPMSIILNASQRNMTLIKYDLVNIVSNIDGIWKWNYYNFSFHKSFQASSSSLVSQSLASDFSLDSINCRESFISSRTKIFFSSGVH